jgi:hypothetical protein
MPRIVTREVDEDQLAADATLRARVQKLLAHPEAGKLIEAANKLVDPNAPTPRLDADKTKQDLAKTVTEELAALRKEREDEKAERERQSKLDQLGNSIQTGLAGLRRQGWTDEGIAAVQKIMEEKGITDPEIAAAYHEKLHPPMTPGAPGAGGAWNFMEPSTQDNDDLKKLIETKGENVPLLDKMVRDALVDVRGQNHARR